MRLLFWRPRAVLPVPPQPALQAEPTAPEPWAFDLTRDELMQALIGMGDIPPDVWEANMAEVEANVDQILREQGIDPAEAADMTPQEFHGR
jgi:hypothetical protein